MFYFICLGFILVPFLLFALLFLFFFLVLTDCSVSSGLIVSHYFFWRWSYQGYEEDSGCPVSSVDVFSLILTITPREVNY